MIQTALVEGVSTRKVDDPVRAMGLTGTDKSRESRIGKEVDEGDASGAVLPPAAGAPGEPRKSVYTEL